MVLTAVKLVAAISTVDLPIAHFVNVGTRSVAYARELSNVARCNIHHNTQRTLHTAETVHWTGVYITNFHGRRWIRRYGVAACKVVNYGVDDWNVEHRD